MVFGTLLIPNWPTNKPLNPFQTTTLVAARTVLLNPEEANLRIFAF